jgi:pimeloyl-ACP methyl ester carboxylesterase
VRTVDLGDVQLHVEDRGSGEPALVLVHGYTGSTLDWADSHDALAADRRVVAYDHRGHGQSTHAPGYSIEALAEDFGGVLDDLGLDRVDLLGHSLGGIVALQTVLDHPERVRSLMLMDTSAEPVGNLAEMLEPLVTLGRDQGMTAVFELSRPFIVASLSGDDDRVAELTGRLEAKYGQLDVEAFDQLGRHLGTYPSLVDRLGEIACPTTVLVGEGDTGLRPSDELMAKRIDGAELVVLPGGHCPQEDDPAAWQAAVQAHLSRVG